MKSLDLSQALKLLEEANCLPVGLDPRSREYAQAVIDGLVAVSMTDPLTGLGNRCRLEMETERCIAAAHRGRHSSILVLDIDHFKSVNDTHGHAVGDEVIRKVAEVIRAGVRVGDSVFRVGGEEFAAVLDGASPEDAYRVAERILRVMASAETPAGRVTLSIGVAATDGSGDGAHWVQRADECLYAAKKNGRNRTIVDLSDVDR